MVLHHLVNIFAAVALNRVRQKRIPKTRLHLRDSLYCGKHEERKPLELARFARKEMHHSSLFTLHLHEVGTTLDLLQHGLSQC